MNALANPAAGGRTGPTALDRAGGDRRRAVHGRARRRDRERRAADDQDGPALQPGKPAVGRDRLLDPVRRRVAARRSNGRPARPPPALHGGPRHLHDVLPARRVRLVGGLTRRVPRAAGARRGPALAGRALDPDDDLRGGTRQEPRARHLGRGLRQRRRRRSPARRRPDELPQLVVDLLHQRAGRGARVRARAAPGAREPGGCGAPPLRPARRRLDHRRSDAARLRDDAGRSARLGHERDDRAARRVRRAHRRVRRDRGALERAAAAATDVPAAHADGLQHRRAVDGRRRLLAVLPADAVHAAGAALLGAPDRGGLRGIDARR